MKVAKKILGGSAESIEVADERGRRVDARGPSPLEFRQPPEPLVFEPPIVMSEGAEWIRRPEPFDRFPGRFVAVAAPGYIEQSLQIPYGGDFELSIPLERGGAVDVLRRDGGAHEGLNVELFPFPSTDVQRFEYLRESWPERFLRAGSGTASDGAVAPPVEIDFDLPEWFAPLRTGEPVRFNELRPGAWIAALVDAEERYVLHDWIRFDVAADANVAISLGARNSPLRTGARLCGTLSIAPGWEDRIAPGSSPEIEFCAEVVQVSLSDRLFHRVVASPSSGSPGEWTFDSGPMVPGLWVVSVPAIGAGRRLEASADPQEIRIEIAEPIEVSLRLRDERGEPVRETRKFIVSDDLWPHGRELELWNEDGVLGPIRVERALTTLTVRARNFGAAFGELLIDLRESEPWIDLPFEIALVPHHESSTGPVSDLEWPFGAGVAPTLVLQLRDGDRIVPCDVVPDHAILLDGRAHAPLSFEGSLGGIGTQDGVSRMDVLLTLVAPGRHELRIDGIPGFAPAGPIEIDVGSEGVTTIEVSLARIAQ